MGGGQDNPAVSTERQRATSQQVDWIEVADGLDGGIEDVFERATILPGAPSPPVLCFTWTPRIASLNGEVECECYAASQWHPESQ